MDLYQNLFHTPELPYAARKLINRLFFRSLAGYLVLDAVVFLFFSGVEKAWWLLLAAEVVALLLGYLVPLYYMVGAALGGEEPFSLVSGAWPLLATAYYVWQGIFFDRWGSAWLVFPTIPLVCIAFDSLDKWWRHRK